MITVIYAYLLIGLIYWFILLAVDQNFYNHQMNRPQEMPMSLYLVAFPVSVLMIVLAWPYFAIMRRYYKYFE